MNYTAEKNILILISLLKAHGIKRVVASPGATNITFVASIQADPYFTIYSCVDERSAAYMACGLAYESNSPVALTCTGATASRNYFPALTEAFYRKLPVLAITSTQNEGLIGQGVPQVIDRSQAPKDAVKYSVSIPSVQGEEDIRYTVLKINRALIELTKDGGGPVHINLATNYSRDYSVQTLPKVRAIRYYASDDEMPEIKAGRIAVFVGSHKKWSKDETKALEIFCEKYNAVALCDHNSSYSGKYRVQANIVMDQDAYHAAVRDVDLLLDIGNISGAYMPSSPKETWRISEDGNVCDTFRTLTKVFHMKEKSFFSYYASKRSKPSDGSYYRKWMDECTQLRQACNDIPFSNAWIAQNTADKIPENSMVYLSILNTLRTWNWFEFKPGVESFSNTGGFGIDGGLSSLVGASLFNKEKLYYAIVGDLQFFYDLNALGNRHIGKNLRVMLINNGIGQEFKNYNHNAYLHGEKANDYIAAAGHFGNKSRELVKHYAEDLGFLYLTASGKEEYLKLLPQFVAQAAEKPILFEVFTESEDESNAIKAVRNLKKDAVPDKDRIASNLKKSLRSKLGDERMSAIKTLIKG